MIYIRTVAYNASETLERTIKSVLNQTYGEFVYYLVENGSTDGGKTKKIVQKYAGKDKRIRAFYNKKNHVWDGSEEALYLPHNIDDNDYFSLLDADDVYKPDFFKNIIEFMKKNDLDIAACGSDFIDASRNKKIGERQLDHDLLIYDDLYIKYYPVYHQFARTIWGKLFKGKTLKNVIIDSLELRPQSYGNDTFFTFTALDNADRFGILSKSLHEYYISPKSTSYIFKDSRINDDRILYNQAVNFLNKYGEMLPENLEFINIVFINACFDTFNVIINSNLTVRIKLNHIREMFDCKQIENIKIQDSEKAKQYFNNFRIKVLQWLFSRKEYNDIENAKLITDIIKLMFIIPLKSLNDECITFLVINNPVTIIHLLTDNYQDALTALKTWYKNNNRDNLLLSELEYDIYKSLKMSDKDVFDLLIDIYSNRPAAAGGINFSVKMKDLLSGYPIFNDLSTGLLCSINTTAAYIMMKDYENAQKSFIQKINSDLEVEENEIIPFFRFAQNLSAFSGDSENYIFFSKIWLEKLIDSNQTEIADSELSEFEKILPDDNDFKTLRERLNIVSGK